MGPSRSPPRFVRGALTGPASTTTVRLKAAVRDPRGLPARVPLGFVRGAHTGPDWRLPAWAAPAEPKQIDSLGTHVGPVQVPGPSPCGTLSEPTPVCLWGPRWSLLNNDPEIESRCSGPVGAPRTGLRGARVGNARAARTNRQSKDPLGSGAGLRS